ncbi:hypothetical protein NPIL_32371 [Nephila pilipes]|uniref:Uncharacterized protein n=1 Tax=Nephila pilipes TaxID=299642 RepID=A0A8X6UAW5_NEPPI|nr:hypothetical protein NPIL_32371 [Nephila pilipes]
MNTQKNASSLESGAHITIIQIIDQGKTFSSPSYPNHYGIGLNHINTLVLYIEVFASSKNIAFDDPVEKIVIIALVPFSKVRGCSDVLVKDLKKYLTGQYFPSDDSVQMFVHTFVTLRQQIFSTLE